MASRVGGKRGLGDYLNETFSLIPRIWKDALPVSIIAVLPAAVALGFGFASLRDMFEGIAENSNWASENPVEFLNVFASFFFVFLAASILAFLGTAYQKAYICRRVGLELEGKKSKFFSLLKNVAGRPWLRVAVQDFVIGAVINIIALVIFFAAMIPVFSAVASNMGLAIQEDTSSLQLRFIWITLLISLVLLAVQWFIQVRTSVSAPASIIEKCNSIIGIGRSLHLSSKNFWRVFWAMFLVSLVISFGLGIVTGPITFGLAAPGYFAFLKESISESSPSVESFVKLFSSLGWVVAVSYLFSGVVQGTLWPSFLTVLYADLRARKGERTELGLDKKRPRGSRRRRIVEFHAINSIGYSGSEE
jgi:hypothetical protein